MLSHEVARTQMEHSSCVDVPAHSVSTKAFTELTGGEELRERIRKLRKQPEMKSEEEFQQFEREFIKANAKTIIKYACEVSEDLKELMQRSRVGWDELHHFRIAPDVGFEQALVLRYIYVPLAYRLGYYTLAPKISQVTFEVLLPDLAERVVTAIARLTGCSEAQAHSLVHERFIKSAPEIGFSYSRPKTPHSVWKKAGSAALLESLSPEGFVKHIDDYIMIVWVMQVPRDGTREDALNNGESIYEHDSEIMGSTEKRTCKVTKGFPVTMMHAVWRGIPVEVQFLGGNILGWLAAMDYAKYKMGTTLDDIEARLTTEQWRERGETMLRIYETSKSKAYEEGARPEFHETLLKEVLRYLQNIDATIAKNAS